LYLPSFSNRVINSAVAVLIASATISASTGRIRPIDTPPARQNCFLQAGWQNSCHSLAGVKTESQFLHLRLVNLDFIAIPRL
jgi:hypothetical protein